MTTTYIAGVNAMLVEASARVPNVVLYGENINTGSRIGGLTKGLRLDAGGRIINVGNCESTHCGIGFGLMMNGVPAVLYAKQLDFMLLGVDHFVSTYNAIRSMSGLPESGSFTIVTIVCDQGYQGPQSSFNALGDLCSLARVPGYALTNRADAAAVIDSQIGAPGFRIIALSQRLFGTEFLGLEADYIAPDRSVLRYRRGADATIVCLNFSLPEGLDLADRLMGDGRTSSLFSVNPVFPIDWSVILDDVAKTDRLAILDDSKGAGSTGFELAHAAAQQRPGSRCVVIRRERVAYGVDPESFGVDLEAVAACLFAEGSSTQRS